MGFGRLYRIRLWEAMGGKQRRPSAVPDVGGLHVTLKPGRHIVFTGYTTRCRVAFTGRGRGLFTVASRGAYAAVMSHLILRRYSDGFSPVAITSGEWKWNIVLPRASLDLGELGGLG